MGIYRDLGSKIVSVVGDVEEHEVILPIEVGDSHENEMVMFMKPEVFLEKNEEQMDSLVNMMLSRLEEYEVSIHGAVVMGGKTLEENEIMNRHYGYINQMSRMASKLVTPEDEAQIADKLGIEVGDYKILGGHELLSEFEDLDPQKLDNWWFESGSSKIRSGFYVRSDVRAGKPVVLVNAFHPEQLAHFTRPERRIVLSVLRSNQNWDYLRNEMIGDTFPERAKAESIRGAIYGNPEMFGFKQVNIGNNAVHLSAGPSEALFEMNNFLKDTVGFDAEALKPNLIKRMLDEGIAWDKVIKVLENPVIEVEGVVKNLHDHAEHKNTSDVVRIWKMHVDKFSF